MRARFLALVSIAWVACGRLASSPVVSGDGGGGPVDGGRAAADAGGDAALSCDEQVSETQGAIDDAVARLVASTADVSCTRDSDCVIANIDSACWSGCGGGPILNQAGAAQLAADVAEINASTCASYTEDGCPPLLPPPCPPLAGVLACVSGACGVSTGAQSCVLDGGTWYCPGLGTYPACPSGEDGPGGSPSSCQYDGGCFGCIEQGMAGATCACGGDGGTEWECLPANRGCSQ